MLKYFTHSHIKFIIMHGGAADSFCNMMFAAVQCRVPFLVDFDDAAQSEAAVFIVFTTALMMSDSFYQWLLEECRVVGRKQTATKGAFSSVHVVTSGGTVCAVHSEFKCFFFLPLLFFFHSFYSSPYSISTNRMIAQTSITPFIAASPVSTYQVSGTSPKLGGGNQDFRDCKTFKI